MGTITKKWKCASIVPPDRCTKIPETTMRPIAAETLRTLLGSHGQHANAANAPGTRAS